VYLSEYLRIVCSASLMISHDVCHVPREKSNHTLGGSIDRNYFRHADETITLVKEHVETTHNSRQRVNQGDLFIKLCVVLGARGVINICHIVPET
jgi:hypothetical protein